jgi:SAM-dependent methyltransferase
MAHELQYGEPPWQLGQFGRSLKKQLKLEALLDLLGDVSGQDCLLITCGDNNGALNWYFRQHGGTWTWADMEGQNLTAMSAFLGELVYQVSDSGFPFADKQFDCVVAIDVLEHLQNDQPFLGEVRRVLRANGRAVVTVPNGNPQLLANQIKWRVGMTPEVYGHTRAGYTIAELQASISKAGLSPENHGGYSRFFTEMVELVINYGYVFVLSRKDETEPGHIAPTTSGELKTHGAAYQLYSLLFPVIRLISRLDQLLTADSDNAVIVTAVKVEAAL